MGAPASEKPRVRVAALLRIDGRIVCVRHRAGSSVYHLLPGGGVGYRETLEDALKREVREETGLQIELGAPLFINDTIDPNGRRHVVNLTFAAEVIGGEITSEPEDERVEGVDLIEPGALQDLDLRPPLASAILGVLDSPAPPSAEYLGLLFSAARRPPGQPTHRPTEEG